jgi:hypothetical protein
MRGRIGPVVAGLLIAAACKGSEAPRHPLGTGSAPAEPGVGAPVLPPGAESKPNPHTGLSLAAKAALDSGNKFYRAQQYPAALAQYRAAVKASPLNPAPYYGIFMVAEKLGNKALADSAKTAFESRQAGAGSMFADSLMEKTHTKAAGAAKSPSS